MFTGEYRCYVDGAGLFVLPAPVRAVFLSSEEEATRSVVEAGGIGLQLADRIRVNNWDEVGFLLLMILLTVSLIDQLSKTIRTRFI
jgi:phosphonate transport system permease protein